MELNTYESPKEITVSDQPGLKIFLTGFVIAAVLGLIFRGITSPDRVYREVEKASLQVHKDIKVKFDSAELKIADGILPRFFILIKNVTMQAENPCWYRPTVRIENIELPIVLHHLIRGQNPITKIYADHVDFFLYGKMEDCQSGKSVAVAKTEMLGQEPSSKDPVVKLVEQSKMSTELQSIEIKDFKIRAVAYMKNPIEVKDVVFSIKSQQPRVLVLRAKTNLFKDEQLGDFLSHSNVYLEYSEQPEPTVQTSFFGNFREGIYSLNLKYNIADQMFVSDFEIKHAPAQVIIQFLKRLGFYKHDYEPKLLWLSLKSHSEGNINQFQQAPIQVKDLKFVSDTGDFTVPSLQIESLSPLKMSRSVAMVNNINLDRVLYVLNIQKTKKTFGELGKLTGVLKFSEEDFNFVGQLKGLEFIFANKGQRESQFIESVNLFAEKNQDQVSVHFNEFVMNNGELQGEIKINHNEKKKNSILSINLENLKLNSEVQRLITNEGLLGPLQFKLNAKIHDTQVQSLSGQFSVNNLEIEKINLNKIKGQLSYRDNQYVSQISADSALFKSLSPAHQLFFKTGVFSEQEDIELSRVLTKIHTDDFSNLGWDTFSAQVQGSNRRINSVGGWNQLGEVKGSLYINESGKERHWKIQGTRDKLILEK